MKKMKLYLIVVLMAVFTACEYVDFDENGQVPTGPEESQLVLKAGILTDGTYVVQKDVNTTMMVVSKTSTNPITSATWIIETASLSGASTTYLFTTLGQLNISVTATFQNGTTETRTFTFKVVKDMSPYDPVKFFVGTPDYIATGKWTGFNRWPVTVLVSKKRMANKTVYGYSGSFNDDTPDVWLSGIKISAAESNYVIKDGVPTAVSGDVGEYVAVKLNLIAREYSLAVGEFEKADGTGVFIWGDWGGSAYVKVSENVGIIKFSMNPNGTITPLGDGYVPITGIMPGTAGDNGEGIFRNEFKDGKFIAYFKLSSTFNGNTPFAMIKNQETGVWGEPIALAAVANYENYGKLELLEAQVLNNLTSVRFGNTITTKAVDFAQMAKSSHFNSTFSELRFTAVKN